MYVSKFVLASALVLAGLPASSHALVLAQQSPAQKHRTDIGNQLRKYGLCLAKAALTCEKKGATSGYECDLGTGVAAGTVEPKAAGKFFEKVVKCNANFQPDKKSAGSSYDLIGCPGDCDDVAAGLQRCTDIAAYEAHVEDGSSTAGIHTAIAAIAMEVDANCASFHGTSTESSANVMLDCVGKDWKQLVKYAKGAAKCVNSCQSDYKDKKGFGGLSDDPICEIDGVASAFDFDTCLSKKAAKHLLKVEAPGNVVAAKALYDAVLNDLLLDLYDKSDPTAVSIVPVCSTCGDNLRQGIEECDGTDAIFCGTGCNPDCTCF